MNRNKWNLLIKMLKLHFDLIGFYWKMFFKQVESEDIVFVFCELEFLWLDNCGCDMR